MNHSRPANDPESRRQMDLIEAALRQVESARSTVGGGHVREDGTTNSPRPTTAALDGIRRLKGYRFESEIHRGGQGVVYRAKQESTGKTVAVKVVLGGRFAGPQQMARFDREVRILARMQHPNIVTIHDSGVVDGAPYYVMDYIDGRRLDDYVRNQRPNLAARLELFAEVCSAVHAAHLHGVIHRDLKPGNILIDDAGRTHVLDFGLAKAIGDSDTDASMTETGQFIGSLPWASPEQVASRESGIDLRTDVYSLGVILFQLLTDTFPYSVTGPTSEVIHRIAHEEPKNPQLVNRRVDSDLATIALKALEKDRDRRYQGAGALADDVRRYLNGEPIDAKRSSLLYLVTKRLRRHKWLTALAALSVLSVLVGLVVSVALWRLARQREELALRNAKRAETVQKFLTDMMTSANTLTGGRADISVREVIDESIRQLDDRPMVDEPEIESHLRLAIGRTYGSLGLFDEAQRQLEMARDLARRDSATETKDSLEAWTELVGLLRRRGDADEAQRNLNECLAAVKETLGELHRLTAQLVGAQATIYRDQGDYQQSEATIRDALRIAQAAHAPPEEMASLLNELSLTLDDLGRLSEAIELQEQVVELFERSLGPTHPSTAVGQSNLAGYLVKAGEIDRAEKLYLQSMASFQSAGGNRNLNLASVLQSLGNLYSERKDFSRAAERHREALAIRREALPDSHIQIAHSLNNLALCQYELGRLSDALMGFEEALAIYTSEYGDDHPFVASFLNNIASVSWANGDYPKAASYLQRALQIHESQSQPDQQKIAQSQYNLGCVLEDQGKFAEAESILRQSLESRLRLLGPEHADIASSKTALSRVLRRQDRLDEAEPLGREALRLRKELFGDESLVVAESLGNLAQILVAQKKAEDALPLIDEAIAIGIKVHPSGHWRVGELYSNRAKVLLALDRKDDARDAMETAYRSFVDSLGAHNRRTIEILRQLRALQ